MVKYRFLGLCYFRWYLKLILIIKNTIIIVYEWKWSKLNWWNIIIEELVRNYIFIISWILLKYVYLQTK